ncbi:MAG: AraC family transcriptional regulator [Eubacteriales bacterium]|nr:AraC family transcriptional regulator [Eubacteriales bacterium]
MEGDPIEWYDPYENTKERKVYTRREHGIPGLRMFGYHNASRARPALNLHYHKNSFEFTYVVQGNLRFFVNGHYYSISGGDLFVTFPDEIHDTGNTPMSLHQMYWFQLEADDPGQFLFMDPVTAALIIERLHSIPVRVIKSDSSVGPLLASIFENISRGTELGRIEAGQQLGALLCQTIRDSDQPGSRPTPDIGRATEYILDHIGEALNMEELAGVALLSVSRFKQKFKSQMGTSPRSFVNYHKIEAAKRMLQDGQSVTDTAMELSFSSSNYFSAVFRRYTSLSPTDYVNQITQKRKPDPD